MATTSYGSVREVWFATLDNPSTKFSFLIRDDAYSKAGAAFGRTIRSGDPIDLGPQSGWRQLSWEGGGFQEYWKDPQMFLSGRADPQTRTGKLTMWGGYKALHKGADRKVDYAIARSGTHTSAASNLYIAERAFFGLPAGYIPSGGWNVLKYDPTLGYAKPLPMPGLAKLLPNGWKSIAMIQSDDFVDGWVIFTNNTQMWMYIESTNTFAQDTFAPSDGFKNDSVVSFGGAVYYLSGRALCRRVPAAGGFGVGGTHTRVKELKSCDTVEGLTVWNNRMYFGARYRGFRSSVYVSDGVTSQKVLEFPEPFLITHMHVHYGALYIAGLKPNAALGTQPNSLPGIGQVWKFTGSSLTKLYDGGHPNDNKPFACMGMTSYNQNLVFGVSGVPGQDNHGLGVGPQANDRARAGVMFYDAEKDALFEGPGVDYDPLNTQGISVSNVIQWDNTLVVAFGDAHNYGGYLSAPTLIASYRPYDPVGHTPNHDMSGGGAVTFGGNSFENLGSVRTDSIVSSRYHGDEDVAMTQKTWLFARVRARLTGTQAQVRLSAITEEGGTEQPLKTWTWTDFGSQTGWRTFVVPLKDVSGKYLKSEQIQYVLYLDNTATGFPNSHSWPEVDSIETLYTVSPSKRRTWRLRAVLEDAQLRLDGSANSLTTASALKDKLEELWSSRQPVWFWDAGAAGGAPTDTSTAQEVFFPVDGFLEQDYRVVSDETTVVREVTLTAYENVIG